MIAKEIKTIEDGIIFKFVESISSNSFDNKTEWGFEIKDAAADMKAPRWAQAQVIGPKVKHVVPEDYILIQNLQWTNALEYAGDKFWKTNESKVIMISKERPKTI